MPNENVKPKCTPENDPLPEVIEKALQVVYRQTIAEEIFAMFAKDKVSNIIHTPWVIDHGSSVFSR